MGRVACPSTPVVNRPVVRSVCEPVPDHAGSAGAPGKVRRVVRIALPFDAAVAVRHNQAVNPDAGMNGVACCRSAVTSVDWCYRRHGPAPAMAGPLCLLQHGPMHETRNPTYVTIHMLRSNRSGIPDFTHQPDAGP